MSDNSQLKKVERAKKLARKIASSLQPERWELARLCWELVNEDGMKPGDLARELDRTVEYVRQLRRTNERYGDEANRDLGPDATFRDYRIAANSTPKTEAKTEPKAKAAPASLPPDTTAHVTRVLHEVVELIERKSYRKAQESIHDLMRLLTPSDEEVAA